MKRFLVVFALISAVFLLVYSCSQNTKDDSKPTAAQNTLGKAKGSCNCYSNPANCPDCVNDLMKGKDKAIYTIRWDACDNSCNVSGTSTVTFCYGDAYDCKIIAMQIDNPPPCLPCIPDPYCVVGTVDCQNGNTASFTYKDPDNQTEYAVTFVGDPKFTLTCRDTVNKISYQCSGEAILQTQ
jgi:hypothetical protein